MNQRGKNGSNFNGVHVIEVASEDEISQQHLMIGIYFASYSALQSHHTSVH